MTTKLYYVDPDNVDLIVVSQKDGYEDDISVFPLSGKMEIEDEEEESEEEEEETPKPPKTKKTEGRGKRLTPEEKEGIQKLLKSGKNIPQVMREYGVSYGTILAIRNKMAVQPETKAEEKEDEPDKPEKKAFTSAILLTNEELDDKVRGYLEEGYSAAEIVQLTNSNFERINKSIQRVDNDN